MLHFVSVAFKSFRVRILASIFLPLIVIQVGTLVFSRKAIENSAMEGIQDNLALALAQFQHSMSVRFASLQSAATMLASDYALKQAFATGDPLTLGSVLENHQARIGAETMFLTSMEGDVISASSQASLPSTAVLKRFLHDPERQFYTLMARAGDQVMKLVVVPLRAPVPVAWIFLGFPVTQQFAEELKQSSGVEVSFLLGDAGGPRSLIASTLPAELAASIPGAAGSISEERSSRVQLGSQQMLTSVKSSNLEGGGVLQIVLQRSMNEALGPLDDLRSFLLLIFAGSALVSLGIAYLLSSSIANPVRRLAVAAQAVGAGDFSVRVESRSGDELGNLARTFNLMTEALERERAIRMKASDDLRRKVEEQAALFEISMSTNFVASFDEILGVVSDKILMMFPVRSVVVFLRKEGGAGVMPVFKKVEGPRGGYLTFLRADLADEGSHGDVTAMLSFLSELDLRSGLPAAARLQHAGSSFLVLHQVVKEKYLGAFFLKEESIGAVTSEHMQMLNAIVAQTGVIAENSNLYRDSITDGLTGLFNKRFFQRQAQIDIHRARRGKRPLALLLFDVDFFKKVNDTHGHALGDAVLKGVAKTALEKVRRSDCVCRVGGEEFAVILPETDMEGAKQVAENLRAAVEAMITPAGAVSLQVTSSFGVAVFPDHAADEDALYRAADEALYRAKQGGRNRVEAAGV
jgi:diguanylate cyclase (GGDEF)-like protein